MSSTFSFKSVVSGAVLACSMLTASASATVMLSWENSEGNMTYGDLAMTRNDDGSSSEILFSDYADLAFDSGLNFFGSTYNSFFINNNGNITFNGQLGSFTPTAFPNTAQPMIAPFWGDVDTRCADCGEVYVGSPNADTIVVTWDDVGYFSRASNKTNSFQLVLIDRADTGEGNFDIEFRYDQLEWTTGNASGGSNGLGGTPAQAGYDAGDNTNYYTLPGSRTSDVLELQNTSNTGIDGVWTFGVRDGDLPGNSPTNPILPIINLETPTEYSFEFVIIEPTTPIFIDPDVAVGYDYIVNSGPLLASVLLPTGFDDNLFDLFLWDGSEWLFEAVLTGGVEYLFDTAVDRFRILGIDTTNMVDPTNATAFVTGLTFSEAGLIDMNQNAIVEFVAEDGENPTPSFDAPEPGALILVAVGLMGIVIRRRKLVA